MIHILLALLMGVSLSSHAVVRIGGGRVQSDSSLGSFQMQSSFPIWTNSDTGGVILSSIPGAGIGISSELIFVDEFALEHPEATLLTQSELRDLFELSYDYTAMYHDNPCIVGFYKGTTSHTFVVTWGAGKGFKLRTGSSSDIARRAILKMIRTLELESGACSWN